MGPNADKVKCFEEFPRPDEDEVQYTTQSIKAHPHAVPLPSKFMRFTHGAMPNSSKLSQQVALPVGAVLRPFAEVEEGEVTPVITSTTGTGQTVIRCKNCRIYINPYCQFTDGGKRFLCPMCRVLNDVSADYFCPTDGNGMRKDLAQHPELLHSMVEFLAPPEYMRRPPQRPTYIFVIDVSFASVTSGFLKATCEAIRKNLQYAQGDPQVAIITYDQFVHVYDLRAKLSQARMMVMPEMTDDDSAGKISENGVIEGVLLPAALEDMLVPLNESAGIIQDLLEKLPSNMIGNQNADCATGPALATAMKFMTGTGGKLSLFSAGLPSIGVGALKNRDDTKVYGTAGENPLLKPASSWYKDLALVASTEQVSIELFLYKQKGYMDIATLAQMPKITTGQVYLYNMGMGPQQAVKLNNEVHRLLSRETGFEAVMRVRVSAGWKCQNMYGNFYIRSTDLMSVPNIDPDKTFAAQLVPVEGAKAPSQVCVQCAVLYTNCHRERRIRVHTVMLEVSNSYHHVVSRLDPIALTGLMSRQAMETALTDKLETARSYLVEKNVTFLKNYRHALAQQYRSLGTQLFIPTSVRCLPLYTLGLLKHSVLRIDPKLSPDLRIYSMSKVRLMSDKNMLVAVVPRLWSVHTAQMGDDLEVQRCASSSLKHDGVYLLDNTTCFVIWIGKLAQKAVVDALLCGKDSPVRESNPVNDAFWKVIDSERARNLSVGHQTFLVARDGSEEAEAWVLKYLIEDTVCEVKSYGDMLMHLQKKVQT